VPAVIEVVATLKAKVVELEAELAAEQQRSAGHRADYERERESRRPHGHHPRPNGR
jgi:hypothetical protein